MSFSLIILGSSSALPTSERCLPAHVLKVHERFFLIDCGEGTQIQLRKNGIRFGRINHVFISHLHGDHCFGLFGLLSTFNLLGRKPPLHLYADPRLENILAQHFHDFDIHLGYTLDFHPLDCQHADRIYEDNLLTIDSFPLRHRVPACGFLFREKEKLRNIRKEMIGKYNIPVKSIPAIKRGEDFVTAAGKAIPNEDLSFERQAPRSFAYCADTAYHPGLSTKIAGVNLLYHEATFADDQEKQARLTGHSTAAEAARIALKAGVGKLVIGHFSARYKKPEILLEQARQIFPKTLLAEDGLVVNI